jgi:hypothetical protein
VIAPDTKTLHVGIVRLANQGVVAFAKYGAITICIIFDD